MKRNPDFGWGYPPGVIESMIPGCRPQDEKDDKEITVEIVITESERKEIEQILDAGAYHESFPEILQQILESADAKKME